MMMEPTFQDGLEIGWVCWESLLACRWKWKDLNSFLSAALQESVLHQEAPLIVPLST